MPLLGYQLSITIKYGSQVMWKNLYRLITRASAQAYLEDRKVIGSRTYDMIDWISIPKARGSNHNWDLHMSEVICNRFPTVQILWCRHHVTSDQCPFCAIATEDLQHISRCPHVTRQDQWKESLLCLAQWLQEQWTEPGLWQMLIIMLNRWHDQKSSSLFCGSDPIQNRAAWDQHAIGWFCFPQGIHCQIHCHHSTCILPIHELSLIRYRLGCRIMQTAVVSVWITLGHTEFILPWTPWHQRAWPLWSYNNKYHKAVSPIGCSPSSAICTALQNPTPKAFRFRYSWSKELV